ncbi:MAG TPA: hypothetical protein VFQ19_18120 [Nocardioidaceae bacterium]|nr:hypothetical protein [Nocardioidaceae bacterium]
MNKRSRSLPGPDLVPGELRGYRQFELRADGLYPLVHGECGPWNGEIERARCAGGLDHLAPASDCRCGLYGWYLPGSATVALGPASAVISVRGRCVLGDRGFRAAQAHIEAVALPAAVRWNPGESRRARQMLAASYPRTAVYDSTRQMLKDFPPHDVRGLGIDPPRDRSRGYRAAVVLLWATVVLPTYALAAVPRETISEAITSWWPLLVVIAIGWQVGMVWLVTRLLALQTTGPTRGPFGSP